MDDLISRQAVIDLWEQYHPYIAIKACEYDAKLRRLPSAQADSKELSFTHKALDTISRQAAIDAADRVDYTGLAVEDVKKVTDEVVKELKQLPAVQPEPQWIPCSERLPKDRRQVLVYARNVHYALAKYDEMREADGTYKKQWVTFDAWKPYHTIKDVIKWMPLPEP